MGCFQVERFAGRYPRVPELHLYYSPGLITVISSLCLNRLSATFSESVMRNEAYEKAYCDAREVLYNRGKKVGGPQRAVDVRYCPVDGLPLTDRELLMD